MSTPISQQQLEQQQQQGPPWLSPYWALGGLPEKKVDVPITVVFLALFVLGAATHMTIFRMNMGRGHKFVFSGATFGFCMARLTTCVLRIVSIYYPENISLTIAAQIFVSAGVILLFVINIMFAHRILRAQHPHIGWHPALKATLLSLYVLIVLTLVIVIIATVQSFYTLSTNTRRIDRDLQLYGSTTFLFFAILPCLILAAGLSIPRRPEHFDKFGAGRFRTKIIILTTSSLLLAFGAAYRTGTSFRTPVLKTQPLPAYFHKAAFYIANFAVEIIVVALYAVLRVDLRFHTPNGAKGPGSYQAGLRAATADDKEAAAAAGVERENGPHIFTEEETFDQNDNYETDSPDASRVESVGDRR